MLIKFEVKSRMAICYFGWLRFGGQQVPDVLLHEQGTSEDSHDLVDVAFKFHLVFNDGDKAISAYGRVDLNSDRVLGIAPEGGYPEMLLNPFEEEFHLPAVLVQEDDLLGREVEVIGVEGKTPVEVGNIGHDSSDAVRIVSCVALSGETHCLIHKDVSALRHVQPVFHGICRLALFPYDEEGADLINLVETVQVPVPPIKDVPRIWLIVNVIHGVYVMYGSIGDVHHDRDLSDDVKLGVQLDSRLGGAELCPVIVAHAKVYSRGVKGIELPSDAELPVNTGTLSESNHVVGELFEHMPVAMGVASGENVAVNCLLAESKVERLLAMGRGDVGEFSQTPTSQELAEHQHEQLPPIGELPAEGSVFHLVLEPGLHDSFKFSFWQKVSNLAENISSCVHGIRLIGSVPIITNSKVRQGFFDLKVA